MKTLNFCLSISILFIFLNACTKKSNDCDPNNEESACYGDFNGKNLLLSEHSINGDLISKYEYDQQNRRIKLFESDGLIEYTYDNNGLIIKCIYKNTSGNVIMQEDYHYGNSNRPISKTISNPTDNNFITIDAVYTYSNKKIVETSTPRQPTPIIIINTFLFDDNDNLISLVNSINGTKSFENVWSQFDDKSAVNTNGDPFNWKNSKNNAQNLKILSPGLNIDQTWKYTYNNSGYPSKALVYKTGTDILLEEHQFKYIVSK